MIELRSFLRTGRGDFVAIQEVDEPPRDPFYIDGALDLVINGQRILGMEEWDLVDQLWMYITDMIDQMRSADEASTWFPDQPIGLSFKRITAMKQMLVTCSLPKSGEVRKVVVEEEELLAALRSSGIVFFEKLAYLVPQDRQSYLDAIERLRS